MSETALVVDSRTATGKGAVRKLRAAGRIPAILYGQGKESVPLAIDPRALEKVLRAGGANALLDLPVEGRPELGSPVALVKELQRHPIRGTIVHADLYQVDLTRTVEVEVPVHLVGKAKGIDFGGILEHSLREIALECLPRSIPASIEVDVSNMEVGDVIHVRDLVLPPGVSLVSDPDLGVVHVALPAAEEEAPVAAAAEGAAAAPAAAGEAAAAAARCEEVRLGRRREARRWPRQSRWRIRAHATQRRLPHRRARRSATPDRAATRATAARHLGVGNHRRRRDRAARTADLHESVGARVLADSTHPLDPATDRSSSTTTLTAAGRLRLRAAGGAGGHNGIGDIQDQLGRNDSRGFASESAARPRAGSRRLRARAVHRGRSGWPRTIASRRAADAVEAVIADGALRAMNRVNATPKEDASP
jgi:large subunit ribosomal protein L25